MDGITERGVWAEDSTNGLQLVVRADDIAPGTGGRVFQSVGLIDFNEAGQSLLSGSVRGDSSTDGSLWTHRASGPLELLMREGDPVPWQADAIFGEPGFFQELNERGQIMLHVGVRDAGPTFYRYDLVSWENGVFAPLHIDGMTLEEPNVTSHLELAVLGESGEVSFLTHLQGNDVAPNNNAALYVRRTDGTFRLIAREGFNAPEANGKNFIESYGFRPTRPTGEGLVTFLGDLSDTGNERGIWTSREAKDSKLLVRAGDPVPGEAGFSFSGMADLEVNDVGKIAFKAGIADDRSPFDNVNAILSERQDGLLSVVVRTGDVAPSSDAATFSRFANTNSGSAFSFNDLGQVLFSATIQGVDITPLNDEGMWAQDRNGAIQLIVREGQAFDVDDGPAIDLRTTSWIDWRWPRINNRGQVAFNSNFSDGASGVFVSNAVAVPELGTLQLSIAAMVSASLGLPRFATRAQV